MISSVHAREILTRCDAHADFFTLPSRTIDALLIEADKLKYRKAKNAPGSRARMFHAYLERRASSLTALAREAVAGNRNATITMQRGRRRVTVSNW